MPLNATTKTGADVAKAVRRQFGDESGVQITDEDLLRWINDGQKQIINKNKVLKAKATISSVANQADYTLPEANIAEIEAIHWDGVPVPGIPYPEVQRFISESPNSALNDAGVPRMWYMWAGVVTFWPTPVSIGTITLLYVEEPAVIDALTSTLSLPDRYFNTLVQYVLAQAYEMDEDWTASDYKAQQMENSLNVMADDERTTSAMTYPVISTVVDY